MPLLDAILLAEWTGGRWISGVPSTIRGVSSDSRTIRADELFVAVKGPNFDGHDFLEHAFNNGAAGAVVSRDVPCPRRALLRVSNTAEALVNIASCYRKAVDPEVVAVTGSVGKTTVKEMTADVLSLKAPVARTIGNWNNEIGLPLSLLAMEKTTRIGVFEVGMNHPGEIKMLCDKLAPDWGIVTNIGPVHLEHFDSIRAIAEEKSELLQSLPHDGTAVLRNDQEWFEFLKDRTPCGIITIAMAGDADYVCEYGRGGAGRMRVTERSGGGFGDFKLPLPGRHAAENALFAVAVGRAHGLDWEEIARVMEAFNTQPMRWERDMIDGVAVINDAYNANPLSMTAALNAFAGLESAGRKWLVLGGMRELGAIEEKAHIELGMQIAAGRWAGLVAVGPLGGMIADGAERGGMEPGAIFRCRGHDEAAVILKEAAGPGDMALLKASRGDQLDLVLAEWKKIRQY